MKVSWTASWYIATKLVLVNKSMRYCFIFTHRSMCLDFCVCARACIHAKPFASIGFEIVASYRDSKYDVDLTEVNCRIRFKEDWPLTAVFERFNENHFFFASRRQSVSTVYCSSSDKVHLSSTIERSISSSCNVFIIY